MKKLLFAATGFTAIVFHFLSFHLSNHSGCEMKSDARRIAHVFVTK